VFSPAVLKPLTLIAGHYGVGKTNVAVNFAMDLRYQGHAVRIVDMDIVNPYFRTSDYTELLEDAGVEVIAPLFARTTLDTPALSPAIAGAFASQSGITIVDVGGDDVGATALGTYRSQILARDHDFLYVVNANRNLTQTPTEALAIMHEIEAVTGLRFTGIINNTHLQNETTCETIEKGEAFGEACAAEAGLPLVCVCVPEDMDCTSLKTPEALRYPTRIYVKPPW
jgi:hypothetical protein